MTRTLQNNGRGADWMSVKEAADELGVSPTTIHKLIQSQQIVAGDFSTGDKANWRIRREDWQRYVDAAVARATARFSA